MTGAGPGPYQDRPDRDRLAAAQAGLLAALLAGAPAPVGFDPDRVRVQRNALIAKRRDLVARWWPELVGPGFALAFTDYARRTPPPAGGLRADAERFAAELDGVRADRIPAARRDPTRRRPAWRSRRSTAE